MFVIKRTAAGHKFLHNFYFYWGSNVFKKKLVIYNDEISLLLAKLSMWEICVHYSNGYGCINNSMNCNSRNFSIINYSTSLSIRQQIILKMVIHMYDVYRNSNKIFVIILTVHWTI